MLKKIITTVFGLMIAVPIYAQDPAEQDPKMQWFADAKLGIFIHWGVYAVDGISESWAFFNNYISQPNYLKQLDGFTAEQYDPKAWVKLIKDSGAKYTVITSKHHDGVSLWDTKQERALSIPKDAKVKQDVLTPFIEEVKASGLKTGIYYSLPDWSHPYYDVITRTQKRYDLKTDSARWTKFIHYYHGQLHEISSQFAPDLLWFDGDWEHTSEEWKAEETLTLLRSYNPNVIINSRLNHHGDYATPEQGIPVKRPKDHYWELCYTMNDSWGYQPYDTHYKTPNMIVRTLVDCIAMGGNLLLDIGPKADGSIPTEQVQILEELGRWTNKYGEAIYGTRAGIDATHCLTKTAFSKDGKTLYIYLDALKTDLEVDGLLTLPTRVRWVDNQENVPFEHDGLRLQLDLRTGEFDPAVSVIALDFEEQPKFVVSPVLGGKDPLKGILSNHSSLSAIQEIVQRTASGANIFKGKLTDDGQVLDRELVFSDPMVKNWVTKHSEVLHDAKEGITFDHYAGLSALSPDKQTLYLFVEGEPTGPIAIKGLKNKIARIRIAGEGSMINHQIYNKLYWSATPGIVYIDVPKERLDKYRTVIAVLLDGPVDLYSEEVKAIESNL